MFVESRLGCRALMRSLRVVEMEVLWVGESENRGYPNATSEYTAGE